MAKKKKKTFIDPYQLRLAVRSHGAERMSQLISNQIQEGEIPLPSISLTELWEGFVGPLGETLSTARASRQTDFVAHRATEAAASGAFSFVTGNIIVRAILDAYNALPSVLDKLVSVRSSRMKIEPVVGFQAFGTLRDVPEGHEYDDSVMAEKATMNPEPVKRGRAITITEETLLYDQTGMVLSRAAALGRIVRTDRERYGIRSIQDLTSYKSYYPVIAGTATQTDIFRAAAVSDQWYDRSVNLKASNALTDWTSVNAALLLFSSMTDENGDEILVNPTQMLVPAALSETALRILNATEVRKVTNTNNTTIGANPVNAMVGGALDSMWSPFMNDTTSWYIGEFPSQYQERVIFPPQVLELPPERRRDIVAGFVFRRKSQVECIDDKYVIKNTA